jgi:predicted nucleotidyltransferase
MLTEQIETVAHDIKNAMSDNLVALYNYGSALTEYYCDFSDLDFLVILKKATPRT